MSLSPEQMRQKSIAQDLAEKHARYAQADGSFKKYPQQQYSVSHAIEASENRVRAATAKENASIGPFDPSPNASIRFGDKTS